MARMRMRLVGGAADGEAAEEDVVARAHGGAHREVDQPGGQRGAVRVVKLDFGDAGIVVHPADLGAVGGGRLRQVQHRVQGIGRDRIGAHGGFGAGNGGMCRPNGLFWAITDPL